MIGCVPERFEFLVRVGDTAAGRVGEDDLLAGRVGADDQDPVVRSLADLHQEGTLAVEVMLQAVGAACEATAEEIAFIAGLPESFLQAGSVQSTIGDLLTQFVPRSAVQRSIVVGHQHVDGSDATALGKILTQLGDR